jgi:hypothetical protein
MAGMNRRPFLVTRMVIDALFGLFFAMIGLGEFRAQIQDWPNMTNLGSFGVCFFFTAGLFIDFARTMKRFRANN